MKKAQLLLLSGLASVLLVGCDTKEVTQSKIEPQYYLTTRELETQKSRQRNMITYTDYLVTLGFVTDGKPYDVIQQLVYDTLPDRKEVYNVRLYKIVELVSNPTYDDIAELQPTLEYTSVTSESKLPEIVMNNLMYGYHPITLDGINYIMEVEYEDYDLTDWETINNKMLELETNEKEGE